MGKSSWGVRPGCFCSCFYHFLFLKKNKNKKASKRKITLYKIGFALITDSSQNLKKKKTETASEREARVALTSSSRLHFQCMKNVRINIRP